jgi:hypothetical protein
MDRLPRVAHIAATALVFGCAVSHKLEVDQKQETTREVDTNVNKTTTAGPEHVVETVEEFAELVPDGGLSHDSPVQPIGHNVSTTPILIKRTVTVTDRGPIVEHVDAVVKTETAKQTATEVKKQDESRPFGLFALLAVAWPFLLAALPVVAGFLAWKLKPPWLDWIWKLLGR